MSFKLNRKFIKELRNTLIKMSEDELEKLEKRLRFSGPKEKYFIKVIDLATLTNSDSEFEDRLDDFISRDYHTLRNGDFDLKDFFNLLANGLNLDSYFESKGEEMNKAQYLKSLCESINITESNTESELLTNDLFKELVPSEGHAKTVGGELVRAYNKLLYRCDNDGISPLQIFKEYRDSGYDNDDDNYNSENRVDYTDLEGFSSICAELYIINKTEDKEIEKLFKDAKEDDYKEFSKKLTEKLPKLLLPYVEKFKDKPNNANYIAFDDYYEEVLSRNGDDKVKDSLYRYFGI